MHGGSQGAIITSLAGALTLLTDSDPKTMPDWFDVLSTIFLAIGLICARGRQETSEDVGAAKPK